MAKISKPSRDEIRAYQLCRQVHQGIDDFLICQCCDPLLEELTTLEVIPQQGCSLLLVVLESPEVDWDKLNDVTARLNHARSTIRAAIGAVIHRKRVPQIRFQVVPISPLI